MSRFKIGDKVLIGGSIATRHPRRKGTVVGVHPNVHSRPGVTLLDKYTVRLDDDTESRLYDDHLVLDKDAEAPTATN